MRILIGHNFYQRPGGEDQVFEAESAMLRDNGHEVLNFSRRNDDINNMGPVSTAVSTLWNHSVYRTLRAKIQRERPDICHFHNTFPLISPGAFYAAKAEGVPVVATLHNFRMICPGSTLLRDNVPCEKCVGAWVPWQAVRHSCYRQSRSASAGVAALLASHRLAGTWSKQVDMYIALNEFGRRKFIQGGVPNHKIVVKPNFVFPDPGLGGARQNYALFVGRLSKEKGIETVLQAWAELGGRIPLHIAGDGPLAEMVRQAAQTNPGIIWLGQLSRQALMDQMKRAHVLLFPSIWYEGGPLTMLEGFATGLPVIASNLGAMADLVDEGRTGFLFEPGSSADLTRAVLATLSPDSPIEQMRVEVRREFEAKYTRAHNYELLLTCYKGIRKVKFKESRGEPSLAAT